MGFPQYIKVLASMNPAGASIIIGSALCRCNREEIKNAHNGQVLNRMGGLWDCPIKKMLVKAEAMVSEWPEGRVHIRSWEDRNNLG